MNTTDDDEMAEVQEKLIEAKDTCSPTTTPPSTRSSICGEAVMTEAWDGWCDYGMAENPDIKFVVPEEGSDLWADTMVVLKDSENKEAAQAFINNILDPEMHAWVAENILYKVPNKAAWTLDPAELKEQFPQLGRDPRRAGRGRERWSTSVRTRPKYTQLATEVTAS